MRLLNIKQPSGPRYLTDPNERAAAQAKVAKALEGRKQALADDYETMNGVSAKAASVQAAAGDLGEGQLELENGLVPPNAAGIPSRLTPELVEIARKRLARTTGLPWANGKTPAEHRAEIDRTNGTAIDPIAQRRAEWQREQDDKAAARKRSDAEREHRNAERKRAHGIGSKPAA